MLSVVIRGPSLEKAHEELSEAIAYADIIELRLDLFTELNFPKLKALCASCPIPLIFTLRSFSKREMLRLAELKPAYMDIESSAPIALIEGIKAHFPNIKIILSHHDFEKTPEHLESLYEEMKKIPAHFYKIAVHAQNIEDAIRLITLSKTDLIGISMGPHGTLSRILSPLNSPITYASFSDEQSTAPGQISAQTLISQYRFKELSSKTKKYGLIGTPVNLSISDLTHNHLIQALQKDALYVKMEVRPSELSSFLTFAKSTFLGLSVTMPLKEAILPFLDGCDPKAEHIGAVNTLVFEEGKIKGFNTDGLGALNALEATSPVQGKRCIILGAGGAARAIAYEAILRGACVTILNRDPQKAAVLAKQFHCEGGGLDDISATKYDILINCTPTPLPIDPRHLLTSALVMDITTKPKDTPLLHEAKKKGCSIIYGYEMFARQALAQFQLWMPDIPTTSTLLTLTNKTKQILEI